MNEEEKNKATSGDVQEDVELQRLLGVVKPAPIDNTRIKSLFREKVEADRRQRVRFRRMVWGIASAAAVIALVVTFSLNVILKSDNVSSLSSIPGEQLAKSGFTDVTVAPGCRKEINLPDGSLLIANAGTHLIYPDEFKGHERRIYADGEIYINVAKDREHPFIVESEGFDVKVLGTIFNIRNITDSTASVVLVEGSVELTCSSKQTTQLRPNDMAEILNGKVTSLRQVDTSDYTSWTNGLITLKGETLDNLAKRLGRYYGLEIACDASLVNVKVYGKLDLRDSVEQVLASIEEIVPMNINRNGNHVSLVSK